MQMQSFEMLTYMDNMIRGTGEDMKRNKWFQMNMESKTRGHKLTKYWGARLLFSKFCHAIGRTSIPVIP